MTVTSKEVLTVLNTNPSYSNMTTEEVIEELELGIDGPTTERYDDNNARMLEMGLDVADCVDNASQEIAARFLLMAGITGDVVSPAIALFFYGLQAGFQLGRGYIED